MPDTMLVVVFDTEPAAYDGAKALKDLHFNGEITLYGHAVISKSADGKVSIIDADDEGPIGAAFGSLVGGMVGLLAGPAGMAAGMLAGASGGMIRDLTVANFDDTFIDDVSSALAPGKWAVLADVFEGWQAPLDQEMTDAGGIVLRRSRIDVADAQAERRADALQAEWDATKAEAKQASDDTKAAVQAKLDALKDAMQNASDDAKAKWNAMEAEANARVAALEDQMAKASAESKAKFEKRVADIKADLAERGEKLSKAAKLAGEALA
ncbi:DUF1269 domain-containing protein [Falsiphaeobacter marinintestinus]|uniref:DUF1269 domain-containing protein n=1 Tax=Falsiphaeobacter marinintestinus TaxID=1492905 RepID=UPI001644D401|nr:DUF1269 domain-containing protein [Phaeobacter marinintestinus]